MSWMLAVAAAVVAAAAQQPVPPPGPAAFTVNGAVEQGGLLTGRAPAGALRLSLDGRPVPLAPDGRFVVGLDRDLGARAVLAATLPNGRTATYPLAVAPRIWRLERIDAARRPGGPTAAFLAAREGELARINAARARQTGAQGWRQPFIWPARGRISGRFGSQRIYRGEPGSYHSGVDVAPGAGAPVVAPADGIVVLAPPPGFSLEGNLVIIDHGLGLNSAFLHLASATVREGQRVRQGEPIGTVGATGRATGPHLHWALTHMGARIDPERVAGLMRQSGPMR